VIRALAITVSNRAAAGVYADRSGPVLAGLLAAAGCSVDGPLVVPDGEPVEAALRDAIAAGYDVVVTTGGTGLTPGDRTPEMTRRVLDREIPGIAEAIRAAGIAAGVPSAMLSRGLAGLAGRVLIVNLAGSAGGVRDGMTVLAPVLAHAVDQAHGGDHPRPEPGPPGAGTGHASGGASPDTWPHSGTGHTGPGDGRPGASHPGRGAGSGAGHSHPGTQETFPAKHPDPDGP
jgi:molybdenum cofactor synthesis domain-containing protein